MAIQTTISTLQSTVLNTRSNWQLPFNVPNKFTYAWYYGHCAPKCTAWQRHLQGVHNKLENFFTFPIPCITILTKNAYSLKLQQSYKIPTPTGFGPHWPTIREYSILRNCCLTLSKFCIAVCNCFIKMCAVVSYNCVQLFYRSVCSCF